MQREGGGQEEAAGSRLQDVDPQKPVMTLDKPLDTRVSALRFVISVEQRV
jgi:hypothetical protein